MTQKCRMTWVLLLGHLWISPVWGSSQGGTIDKILRNCLLDDGRRIFFVADTFNGFVIAQNFWNQRGGAANNESCIVFLEKNATVTSDKMSHKVWPRMETKGSSYLLYLSEWHIEKKFNVSVLHGRQCNSTTTPDLDGSKCVFSHTVQAFSSIEPCQVRCMNTMTICKDSDYNETICNNIDPGINVEYVVNVTATREHCYNCDQPVKKPGTTYTLNASVPTDGGRLDTRAVVRAVEEFTRWAASCSESSAAFNGGEGVAGVMVKKTDPADVTDVSFAYMSPGDSVSIVSNSYLPTFSRSVTVPREAFDQALASNVSEPYVAMFRLLNMAQDERNSTVLGDEVLAVEMGAEITNLTQQINIHFRNMTYTGTPSCHSWNGEGSRPNWTSHGCRTVFNGTNVSCECTHLTFFAILMSQIAVNETISSSDLKNLTIITQAGCGLSMFFLSIVLFMHFLLRRTKATDTSRILVHLVLAMLLLNLTFLTNNFVAELKSAVGCKIMAVLMHYFMLATFMWFAAQAFHLRLQMNRGPDVRIRHYMAKVSLTCWLIPSVVGIVLLSLGKYGELVIYTDDPADNVAMCWITDGNAQYIVNIGYYALVFIFTFASFIFILSWLYCLKRIKADATQVNKSGSSIVTVMGLCCLLGLTWGFAFFAYGVLRIPSYYIFTVLNSFQGFFLFIYYYTTSHPRETNSGTSGSTSLEGTSRITTIPVDLFNPYDNVPEKKMSSLKTSQE
ncbi:adhesion G-protein coupled receptor G2-like isoform X2 [Scophthalmus maximus]|uniref:adhesion G-protein coupled receptor G2-like isoform X2 n=1 Tax=Scophthalmus maximus TaxID=52904 RepID=UPI001FA88E98|nr:adhesion G-protein coupled receptor G2-like isoform X2 [Scophthalmus maximus]